MIKKYGLFFLNTIIFVYGAQAESRACNPFESAECPVALREQHQSNLSNRANEDSTIEPAIFYYDFQAERRGREVLIGNRARYDALPREHQNRILNTYRQFCSAARKTAQREETSRAIAQKTAYIRPYFYYLPHELQQAITEIQRQKVVISRAKGPGQCADSHNAQSKKSKERKKDQEKLDETLLKHLNQASFYVYSNFQQHAPILDQTHTAMPFTTVFQ